MGCKEIGNGVEEIATRRQEDGLLFLREVKNTAVLNALFRQPIPSRPHGLFPLNLRLLKWENSREEKGHAAVS